MGSGGEAVDLLGQVPPSEQALKDPHISSVDERSVGQEMEGTYHLSHQTQRQELS